MIRTLKYWLVSAAMLAVSCFSTGFAAENSGKKELLVGCEGAFAPFTYINDAGEISGFDIDFIKALGEHLGYDVKIMVLPFDGLIPALVTGNIDLIISGFTISEERAKKVDFSDPYFLCGLTYLLNKEDLNKYGKFSSLNGQTVCVQLGASGSVFAQKNLPDSTLKTFNSPPETYIELGNKGCRAAIHDKSVNDYFLNKDKSGRFVSVDISEFADKEYYGIAVRKGDKAMLNQINQGLKELEADGTFEQISRKWFGVNILDTLHK